MVAAGLFCRTEDSVRTDARRRVPERALSTRRLSSLFAEGTGSFPTRRQFRDEGATIRRMATSSLIATAR